MVPRHGLDSTFLIDLLEGDPSAKEIAATSQLLCTTQLNVYELLQGFYSLTDQDIGEDIQRAQSFLQEITILPLTNEATHEAARIAGFLSRKGQKIEDVDCLIAGILLTHGCTTLVTRNTEHFKRIPGLKIKTY